MQEHDVSFFGMYVYCLVSIYYSDESSCWNLKPNWTEPLIFGSVQNSNCMKKIRTKLTSLTVSKSNLKIFVELDFRLNRLNNLKT